MKNKKPCNANCEHFRCGQRALVVRPKNTQGPQSQNQGQGQGYRNNNWDQRPNREGTAYCNWVGDNCVVAGCNFAFCERRALLPDGSCGLIERESSTYTKTIEDEAVREELIVKSAKEKFGKKKGFDTME